MARPLRPIEDGLIYHVIDRGNNRQDVFRKEGDFTAFLQAIADLKQRRPFELYGYCLLNNHFHLLLRPRGAPISRESKSRHPAFDSALRDEPNGRFEGANQEGKQGKQKANKKRQTKTPILLNTGGNRVARGRMTRSSNGKSQEKDAQMRLKGNDA